MLVLKKTITLLLSLQILSQFSMAQDSYGRVRRIFDEYAADEWEGFDKELLMAVFRETVNEEFLYEETLDLIDELVDEFPGYIEQSAIGYSGEDRAIQLV